MKRFFSILLVVMIAIGCLSIATGAMAEGTKVTLVTLDAVSGAALGSVHMSIWKVDGDTETCIKEITTGSTGKKSITLGSGSYKVTVTAPMGYSSETSTSFKIAKGTEAQRINVKILPAYTCKIKVVDSTGKIVKGAQVYVFNPIFYSSKDTNSSGLATFKDIAHGSRKVEVYVKADGKRYLAYSGKIKITKTGTKTITLPAKSNWTVSKPIRN